MVAENAIPLTPQEAAAIDAFLDPGATIPGIARQLAVPITEAIELLTSPPVAAVLAEIRQLNQLQSQMVAESCRAAALAALSSLLVGPATTPVERRRAATALLRAYQSPSRQRGVSPALTSRERKRPAATDTPGSRCVDGAAVARPSTPGHLDTSTPLFRERPAATDTPGSRWVDGAAVARPSTPGHLDASTPLFRERPAATDTPGSRCVDGAAVARPSTSGHLDTWAPSPSWLTAAIADSLLTVPRTELFAPLGPRSKPALLLAAAGTPDTS